MSAAQVAGLASSLQEKKDELDAQIAAQQQQAAVQPKPQQPWVNHPDDVHLTQPLAVGALPRAPPAPLPPQMPADLLFPGINTSTPAGCVPQGARMQQVAPLHACTCT